MNTCRYTLLILLYFGFLTANAQTPDWQWAVQDNLNEQPKAIATDATGNIYTAGTSFTKHNANGNLIWRLPLSNSVNATDIETDLAGNIYLSGSFNLTALFDTISITSVGSTDIFLAKFNSNGKIQWVRQAGGIGQDKSNSLALDLAGNCYLTGGISSGGGPVQFDSITIASNSGRGFAAKYNINGEIQWARIVGANDGRTIAVSPIGEAYISWFGTPSGVSKLNPNGFLAWTKSINHTNTAFLLNDIAVDKSGNCYAIGSFTDTLYFASNTLYTINYSIYPETNMFLLKYDASGNEIWAIQSKGQFANAEAIALDAQGQVYITGTISGMVVLGWNPVNANSPDIFVQKFDSSGAITPWYKTAGSSNQDAGKAIKILQNGDCIIAGTFGGNCSFGSITLSPNATTTTFLAKLTLKPLSLPKAGTVKEDLELYPNPANAEVNLNMPAFGNGNLQVYNTAGKQIHITQLPASGKLKVRTGNWAGGLYFLRISGNGNAVTHKLVVVH